MAETALGGGCQLALVRDVAFIGRRPPRFVRR